MERNLETGHLLIFHLLLQCVFEVHTTPNSPNRAVHWGKIGYCILFLTALRFEWDKLLYLLKWGQRCSVNTP